MSRRHLQTLLVRAAGNPFSHLAAWVTLPFLLSVLLIAQFGQMYRQEINFALLLITLIILLILVGGGGRGIVSSIRASWAQRDRLHWGWLLVGAAIALRYVLLEFLPPPTQAIIEEVQTGGIAHKLRQSGELPLDFRFTNWMASIGFAVSGYSLEGMRLLFGLAGGLSILLMALTLRRLSVGWIGTLLAVFTFASLRFMVIGGNTAEEIFGGLLFEMLLFYCAVSSRTAGNNRLALMWAGLAGLAGGALMYEYVSYTWVIAVPVLWWLWRGFRERNREERRHILLMGSCYVLCVTLVSAAVIQDVVVRDFTNDPEASSFFEPFTRHIGDRSFPPGSFEEVRQSASKLWDYIQVLTGSAAQPAGFLFRVPNEPVIPMLAGIMFAAAWLYALFGGCSLQRIAAGIALLIIVAYGAVTTNFNIGILIPVAALLSLLSGTAVDAALRAWSRPELRYLGHGAAALTVLIVAVNVWTIAEMSTNADVLAEYNNNPYTVCSIIRQETRNYEAVYMVSENTFCHGTDHRWLFPDLQGSIDHYDTLPLEDDIAPGTLVAVGRTRGLDESVINEAAGLAHRLNSAHTLRTAYTLSGHTAAVSFCYNCDAE